MAFLIRYRKVIAIALLVAALAAWIGSSINGAIEDAERRGLERCQREADAELRKRETETLEQEAADREAARLADTRWQEVNRELQNRVDALTAAGRVDLGRLQDCARRDRSAAAREAAAPAQPHGGAAPAEHDVPPVRDLGIELVRYAGECEQYRQQVKSLQGWILSVQ